MTAADRSALSTLTSALRALGFSAHQPSRDPGRRVAGYVARFFRTRGMEPGLAVFGDHCAPGEFARLCAALQEAGWRVEDAAGGALYVERGCARVWPAAT